MLGYQSKDLLSYRPAPSKWAPLSQPVCAEHQLGSISWLASWALFRRPKSGQFLAGGREEKGGMLHF